MTHDLKLTLIFILFILITIIISIITYLYVQYRKLQISFISKEDTIKQINETNYFSRFNSNDFKARKCYSIKECKHIYIKNIESFTILQKIRLISLIIRINEIIKRYAAFYELPWKLAKFNNGIENSYPFTLNDTIYINDKFFNKDLHSQIQTLIHEKLHLFQRKYKSRTEDYYKVFGFNKINNVLLENVRANPDVEDLHDYYGICIIPNYTEQVYNISNYTINFKYDKNNSNLQNKATKLKQLQKDYNINIEHPNEIFASIIPIFLIELYDKEYKQNSLNATDFENNFERYFPNFISNTTTYLK